MIAQCPTIPGIRLRLLEGLSDRDFPLHGSIDSRRGAIGQRICGAHWQADVRLLKDTYARSNASTFHNVQGSAATLDLQPVLPEDPSTKLKNENL